MVATSLVPRRVKRGWMELKVTQVVTETSDTLTFLLEDAAEGGRPFDYYAGQYLTFRFDDLAPKPIVRSYTMSSSPRQDGASAFTVKRVEKGLVSNWLCDHVKVGTILKARGPIGKFCYDAPLDRPHLVMVAGGSGVTPFVSIMREYADCLGQGQAPQKMTLLVSYRSLDDVILRKDLEEFQRHPNNKVLITLSRENRVDQGYAYGRITTDLLAQAFGQDPSQVTMMTCGPQAIMDQAVAFAQSIGLEPSQIKTESFD